MTYYESVPFSSAGLTLNGQFYVAGVASGSPVADIGEEVFTDNFGWTWYSVEVSAPTESFAGTLKIYNSADSGDAVQVSVSAPRDVNVVQVLGLTPQPATAGTISAAVDASQTGQALAEGGRLDLKIPGSIKTEQTNIVISP